MKTDKSDNELIAEFMGFTPQKSSLGNTYSHPNLMGVYGGSGMKFKYDTSWDWLMPVVERIESLGDSNDRIFESSEFHELMELSIKTSIERVYWFVIQFIKWYNDQSK